MQGRAVQCTAIQAEIIAVDAILGVYAAGSAPAIAGADLSPRIGSDAGSNSSRPLFTGTDVGIPVPVKLLGVFPIGRNLPPVKSILSGGIDVIEIKEGGRCPIIVIIFDGWRITIRSGIC